MTQSEKDQFLTANAVFEAGDDVELTRGKHAGKVARVQNVDVYYSYEWNGRTYGPTPWVGYNVIVNGIEKRYKAGSMRGFDITDEEIDDAKAGLMKMYAELAG